MKRKYFDYYQIIFFYEINFKKGKNHDRVKEIINEYPFIPNNYDELYVNFNMNYIIYLYSFNGKTKYIFSKDATDEIKKVIKENSIDQLINNNEYKFKKTDIRRTYIIYDIDGNEINNLDIKHIISSYPYPLHLNPLYIKKQTPIEADFNLVYFGKDRNNKTQYIYGKYFVDNRNKNRDKTFKNIIDKMKNVEKYIKDNLPINKNNLTNDSLLSVLLLLELKCFIRTGRKKYLKENETIGILTLKTNNISFENDDTIKLNFIGKKNVEQFFLIKDKALFKIIKLIYNKNNLFLFSINNNNLSESFFYKTIQSLGIKLKDIRTYGVNILLMKNLHSLLINEYQDKHLSKTEIKIIVKDVVTANANLIGHSSNVSLKSYISETILNYIFNNLNEIKKIDFKTFMKKVYDIL